MESRRRRGQKTNSIHLKFNDSSVEETKDLTAFHPRERKKRDSFSSDEESKIEARKFNPQSNSRKFREETIMAEGFVVKDPSEDKYYVIKNNGLIVDQGKQDYKTITNEVRSIPFTVKDPTSNLVTLLKSPYKDRLETYYFPYPDFCIEEKDEGCRVLRVEQDEFETCRSYFRYDTNLHIYNSVVRACNQAGMFLKDK